MVDFQNEQAVTLTQAAKLLPTRPNVATLWRWRTAGVRGVRLETYLSGGRRMTTLESLQRFQDRVTAAADGAPVQSRTPTQRKAAIEAADKELAKAGW